MRETKTHSVFRSKNGVGKEAYLLFFAAFFIFLAAFLFFFAIANSRLPQTGDFPFECPMNIVEINFPDGNCG